MDNTKEEFTVKDTPYPLASNKTPNEILTLAFESLQTDHKLPKKLLSKIKELKPIVDPMVNDEMAQHVILILSVYMIGRVDGLGQGEHRYRGRS